MYFWPDQFSATMGIARQMKAKPVLSNGVVTYAVPRSTPQTQLTPAPHLVNDGKANTIANEPGQIDARRKAMLAYLRPAWS